MVCIACFSACSAPGIAMCCAFWVALVNNDVDGLVLKNKKSKQSLTVESSCELSLIEGTPCFSFRCPSESQALIKSKIA